MTLSPSNALLLAVLAGALAAAWGLGCGVFERLLLAARRRLSAAGPAYLPTMMLALLAGCASVVSEGRVRFIFALLMAGLFFVIGAVPALAVFHLSRRIFRTRFSDETKSSEAVD
jgi:hypothetical protein